MNMIDDALQWFNEQRNENLAEEVTYETVDGTTTLDATFIEPASTVNAQGARIRSDKFLCIVNTSDITFEKIRRGNKFHRPGYGTYEVIVDKMTPAYYNDPNHIETVIPVKHVTKSAS